MKLIAEILTGKLFHVEVENDATVGDLKNEIAKQENLPVDRLILLSNGADDEEYYSTDNDEASLKEYGVDDGSHIFIFFQTADTIASPSTPNESTMDSFSGPAYNKDTDEANDDESPH